MNRLLSVKSPPIPTPARHLHRRALGPDADGTDQSSCGGPHGELGANWGHVGGNLGASGGASWGKAASAVPSQSDPQHESCTQTLFCHRKGRRLTRSLTPSQGGIRRPLMPRCRDSAGLGPAETWVSVQTPANMHIPPHPPPHPEQRPEMDASGGYPSTTFPKGPKFPPTGVPLAPTGICFPLSASTHSCCRQLLSPRPIDRRRSVSQWHALPECCYHSPPPLLDPPDVYLTSHPS